MIYVCPCVCGVYCRLKDIKEWIDAHDAGAIVIPFSGVFEQKVSL